MKQEYLKFAIQSADYMWQNYDHLYEESKKNHTRVGHLSFLANVYAAAYCVLKNEEYLKRAKKSLLDVARFRAETNQTDPPLDWMFEPAPYAKAFQMIRDFAGFTQEELQKIEEMMAISVNAIFAFPEQGSENRCVLKAHNLLYAAKVFSNNPMAKEWEKFACHMIQDSIGHWSIEDASTYNTIWVHILLSFNELHPIANMEENPIILYYCKYLQASQLNSGVLADYGDGRWGSDWILAVSCLEKGAAMFHSGELKYAAEKCFRHMITLDKGVTFSTWKMLPQLIDAYFWCDDSIQPIEPVYKSQNVLEDLVGKKVVFRSEKDKPEAFLLLNYRDEGNFGILGRHNLRTSLAVRAEKMHHGHADENGISVLSVNNCVLLHDGGYRKQFFGGEWRADVYHNKLVVRHDALRIGQSVYDRLIDAGSYVQVETEQLYFHTFDRVDSTRTRLTDRWHRVTSDRCIHYLKEENIFVVVDIAVPHQMGEYTIGCLYHNLSAEQITPHKWRMWSDYIPSDEFCEKIPNDTSTKLIVDYLCTEHPVEHTRISRCYTEEESLCQYFSGLADENSNIVMVSLLIPEKDGVIPTYEAKVTQNDKACLVQLNVNGKEYRLCDRFRLTANNYNLNRRPTYCFEKGNSNIDGVESDGLFTCIIDEKDSVYYAFTDATRVNYQGKTLFSVEPIDHLQLDYTNVPGISSWNCWEDTIRK
jgi:hypothetical protein